MTRKTLAIVTAMMLGIATTGGAALARGGGGGGLGGAHVARRSEHHDNDCNIPNYLRIMTNLCAYKTPGLFDGRSVQ